MRPDWKLIFRIVPFLSLINLFSIKISAQSTPNSFIFVSPDNSIIRIDSVKFSQKKDMVRLEPGFHVIKMWAPTHEVVTDTFLIKETGINVYRKKLPYTSEYKSYKSKLRTYHGLKVATRYIVFPATIIYALNYYNQRNSYSDEASNYLNEANAAKESYNKAIMQKDLDEYKSKFLIAQEEYNSSVDKINKLANQAKIIIPIGIISSGILYYLSTKLKRPVYSENVLFSDAGLIIDENNQVLFHLSIKL